MSCASASPTARSTRCSGPVSVGYDDIVSFLHQGEEGKSASVLRTIFDGAQSEALITRWLAFEDKDATIVEKDAAVELLKLVETRLGLPMPENTTVTETRDKGRIPDFPVTRSHPPASWPSAANSSICRTYRKTAGEESRRRSPVANRWMRP